MSLYKKFFKQKYDTVIYEVPRYAIDKSYSEAREVPVELRTARGILGKSDSKYTYLLMENRANNKRVGTWLIVPTPLVRKLILARPKR